MFNTMEIAKRIKKARIEKNLTQMNLADAMGVSFQAVSNWERGNSLPDISKIEELSNILGIAPAELLCMEGSSAEALDNAIDEEELTLEELSEVAPMLPPAEVKKKVESEKKHKKLNIGAIADIAPYLDDEYLDELVAEADLSDLEGLDEIAVFLSDKSLERLVMDSPLDNLDDFEEVWPFLNDETCEKLAERMLEAGKFDGLSEAWVFLNEEACDKLSVRLAEAGEIDAVIDAAPFLSEGGVDAIIEKLIEKGETDDLSDLYPFAGQKSLRKLAERMMKEKDLDSLEEIMPFV